jgi:Eco29kI restriction endonuclease
MPVDQAKPYGRFDFDLASAVTVQLIGAFNALAVGPLTRSIIDEIDSEQGVYQLFIGDRLMYAGKAEVPLPKRLEEHRWNLSGRKNINMDELGFKALIIHRNWAPSVHEDILIRHFRNQGTCVWNLTGIGNHDPGRNREDTVTPEEHFDVSYPIKENFVPEGIPAQDWNALELLIRMKYSLPFIFRYHATHYRKGSPKYNNITVTVPRPGMNIKELLDLIVATFPYGWQATFFPGRVILYEETRDYAHATHVIRKPTQP